MEASLTTGVPIAFGVLTVTKEAHARARSKPGRHNKGREAAAAAVETALLLKKLIGGPLARGRTGKGRP
jgi:6,7-dimethyl-8-ribityllumazine synthase